MTKKNDPNAAVRAAEARSRQSAINEQLDVLGIPHDPRGAAQWHERAAERARLEASRQDLATITRLAVEAEQAEIGDRVAETARERARVAHASELLAEADADLAALERQREADQFAIESAEVNRQHAERLERVRGRARAGLSVTPAEQAWLERLNG